jgi:hypothetical protein
MLASSLISLSPVSGSNFHKGNKVTPRAQRKRQKKRLEQKHTKHQDHTQAISYITAIHSNNMHAYLSTQISRRLRCYGLTCCGDVHESESTGGKVWCKQSYTKRRLNTGCSKTDTVTRTNLVIEGRDTEVATISSSSGRKKTVLVQIMDGRVG